MILVARDRRALLIGASMALVAVLVRTVPAGVRAGRALEAQVEQQRRLLADTEAELRGSRALGDSASRILDRFRRLAFRIIPGSNEAEAQSELAHLIEIAAAHSGSHVLETTPAADSTVVVRLHRISLRTALEGDLRGVVATLRTLERDSVVITIDALSIVANDAPDDQPETLRAEVLIRGWYSAGGAAVPRRAGAP